MNEPQKNAKVLIIEDDKNLREMYDIKLKKEGYDAATAVDGEDGLAKMKSWRPAVVLLDLMMPKKNGFDVLQEAGNDNELKKIPIIVLSNLGLDDDKELAKKLGAKEYVVKSSIFMKDLVKIINLQMI